MSCKDCADKKDSLTARLNKRVTISRYPTRDDGPEYKDAYGQPLDTLVPVATVWAAIEPLQGQEHWAAMRDSPEVTTRIRIRYRDGIDRTMVVQYKGIEYEIMYTIHPKLARVELQLMCKERQ